MTDKYKDWTPVDHEVKWMLMNYPFLYSSRNDCRLHMFCSGGTGYDWNLETGEFECEHWEGDKTSPDFEEIKEDDCEFIRMRKERINLLRQFDWDNVDLMVKDFYGDCYSSYNSKTVRSIHSLKWYEDKDEYEEWLWSPIQYACKYKDKIADHWRHEIRDFCKWVIKDIRRIFYCPSMKDPLTDEEIIKKLEKMEYRKGRELKDAYIAALKGYNGILTDEEKKKEEKHRLRMVKMFDDILKKD